MHKVYFSVFMDKVFDVHILPTHCAVLDDDLTILKLQACIANRDFDLLGESWVNRILARESADMISGLLSTIRQYVARNAHGIRESEEFPELCEDVHKLYTFHTFRSYHFGTHPQKVFVARWHSSGHAIVIAPDEDRARQLVCNGLFGEVLLDAIEIESVDTYAPNCTILFHPDKL